MSAIFLTSTLPMRPGMAPLTILLLIVGATGGGLVLGLRAARVAAGVLLFVCVAAMPLGLVGALARSEGAAALDGRTLFAMANALATTALGTWICFRGLQVVRGKRLRAAVFTSRVTGVALAAIAAHHLYDASRLGASAWGLASTSSFAFRISVEGTALYGFPGWPLWHLAALLTAAVLIAAPRARLVKAAGVLAGLFACVLPLSLGALVHLSAEELAVLAPVLALLLLPILLAWWLREELIGPVPARLPEGSDSFGPS